MTNSVSGQHRDEPTIPRERRDHYENLDFLRGVAAFLVVLFHFSTRLELFGLFNHGYLAVDFFFALSGYVIDRAYGQRLTSGRLKLGPFFLTRVLRLFPMVVAGVALAATIDAFRPGNFSASQHVIDIFMTGAFEIFLLPFFWRTTLEDSLYPLNGPVWSLFFELIANVCHAWCLTNRVLTKALVVVLPCSFLGLIWIALHNHDIHVGPHGGNFLMGFSRVFWSYSVGVLLARNRFGVLPSLNKWFYAALLCGLLACPDLPGGFNVGFDLLVVCIAVPLIVSGAANGVSSRQAAPFSRWCGELSYPLYMLHYPIVRVIGLVGRKFALSDAMNLALATFTAGLMSLGALLCFRAYDVPARRWLTRRATIRSILSEKSPLPANGSLTEEAARNATGHHI
jgi:peptidoglycan/LPS O-acetylase OafA/YrhL